MKLSVALAAAVAVVLAAAVLSPAAAQETTGPECSVYVNLVLDVSGSMNKDRREDLRKAVTEALADVKPKAPAKLYVQITRFGTKAENVDAAAVEYKKAAFNQAVRKAVPLKAENAFMYTNHGAALHLASLNVKKAVADLPDVPSRLVLLVTDGKTTRWTLKSGNKKIVSRVADNTEVDKATKDIHATPGAKLGVVFAATGTTNPNDAKSIASMKKRASVNIKTGKSLNADVDDIPQVKKFITDMINSGCDETKPPTTLIPPPPPPPPPPPRCDRTLYLTILTDISRSVVEGAADVASATKNIVDSWTRPAANYDGEVFVRIYAYAVKTHPIIANFVPASEVAAKVSGFELGLDRQMRRAFFKGPGDHPRTVLQDSTHAGQALRDVAKLPAPPVHKGAGKPNHHAVLIMTDGASYEASNQQCHVAYKQLAAAHEKTRAELAANGETEKLEVKAHKALMKTEAGKGLEAAASTCCNTDDRCNIPKALDLIKDPVVIAFIGAKFRSETTMQAVIDRNSDAHREGGAVFSGDTLKEFPDVVEKAIRGSDFLNHCVKDAKNF